MFQVSPTSGLDMVWSLQDPMINNILVDVATAAQIQRRKRQVAGWQVLVVHRERTKNSRTGGKRLVERLIFWIHLRHLSLKCLKFKINHWSLKFYLASVISMKTKTKNHWRLVCPLSKHSWLHLHIQDGRSQETANI